MTALLIGSIIFLSLSGWTGAVIGTALAHRADARAKKKAEALAPQPVK